MGASAQWLTWGHSGQLDDDRGRAAAELDPADRAEDRETLPQPLPALRAARG